MSNAARTRRFDAVLDRLESNRVPHTGISIVERCWFSNVALGDDWSIHDRNDERAAALGFRLALLDVPDELFATRSLYRAEYDRRDWQAFNEMYGSEAAAIAAIRASQQRRREALTRTRMPTLVLDTAAMDWPAYASVLEVFAA